MHERYACVQGNMCSRYAQMSYRHFSVCANIMLVLILFIEEW